VHPQRPGLLVADGASGRVEWNNHTLICSQTRKVLLCNLSGFLFRGYMSVDWNEVTKALSPVKSYEDLLQRLQESFAFPFVQAAFNFTMPELVDYTRRCLGGDSRHRYDDYAARLEKIFTQLHRAGVVNTLDLVERAKTPDRLETFTAQSKILAQDIIAILKFLLYWFIPGKKYLSGLVRNDAQASQAIQVLSGLGIRSNLDLLQQGISAAGRKALSASSGLTYAVISDLVNRADFSRLPWASKATISNIMGAGYGSIAKLANANPEKLYADFFSYGKAIGKNLKLGNEIENSQRIAKIVPVLVQED
jgi:hypothetical protein